MLWRPKIISPNSQASEQWARHRIVGTLRDLESTWSKPTYCGVDGAGIAAGPERTPAAARLKDGHCVRVVAGRISLAADIHRSVCEQTRCSTQRTDLVAAGLHGVMHPRQRRIPPHRRVFSPASERHKRPPCMDPTRVLGRGKLPVEGSGLRLRLGRKWSPPSLCNDELWKVKTNLSLCLIKHHAMKTYGEVDV
jgi:hypothetical protein